jgi:hypothetical protein
VIRRAVLERYERAGHRSRVDASAEKLNGRTVELEDEAAFRLVMAVAEGTIEVDDVAQRLGRYADEARPLGLRVDVADDDETLDRLDE